MREIFWAVAREMQKLPMICLALLVGASGLHAWNDHVDTRRSAARDMTDRIGRLIKADERNAIDVHAITLEVGTSRKFVYQREGEVWRCPTVFGAVCRTDALDGLVKALMEAEGVVHSSDEQRLAEYGLTEHNRWKVLLHGPGFAASGAGDIQFVVDLGFELADKSGCYARRQGNPAVWATDTNPWASIGLAGVVGGAPMVDPAVIARAWLQGSARFERIDVHTAGGNFSMLLRQREVTQEDMRKGVSPNYWVLDAGGVEQATDEVLSMAYNAFLFSAPLARIVADTADEVRGKGERGRVVLRMEGGDAALVIGADDGQGGVLAWFEPTRTLVSITPEVARLLLPSAGAILPGGAENLWAAYLRAR